MNYRVWLWFLLCWPGLAFAAPCKLLILGDSLSSGYGLAPGNSWVQLLEARMKRSHPQWQVVNASISGDTTQNGLQRLGPVLQRQHPQGVLIELGGNDALRGIPPETIRQNLMALIRQAKNTGAWVLLFDVPVLPNYGKAYAERLAKVYEEVAKSEKVARVPCFVCGVATNPKLMQADGIHPNEQAKGEMLDAVWPSLRPKLKCPANKS